VHAVNGTGTTPSTPQPTDRTLSGSNRGNDAKASGVREPSSACAEDRLGPISSSRCQTTRNARITRAAAKLVPSGRTSQPQRATLRADRPDNNAWHSHRYGGARRDRTDDLMLAKHALSQLSYGPFRRHERFEPSPGTRLLTCSIDCLLMVGLGGLEPPTSRLSSARSNQLSYKPGQDASTQTPEDSILSCLSAVVR
jgi:hypothetical protein